MIHAQIILIQILIKNKIDHIILGLKFDSFNSHQYDWAHNYHQGSQYSLFSMEKF